MISDDIEAADQSNRTTYLDALYPTAQVRAEETIVSRYPIDIFNKIINYTSRNKYR